MRGCDYLSREDERCKYCDDCELRGRCGASGFCDDGCRNLDALPVVSPEVESALNDDAQAYFAWRGRVKARQQKTAEAKAKSTGLPYNVMSNEAWKRWIGDIAAVPPVFDLRAVDLLDCGDEATSLKPEIDATVKEILSQDHAQRVEKAFSTLENLAVWAAGDYPGVGKCLDHLAFLKDSYKSLAEGLKSLVSREEGSDESLEKSLDSWRLI